MNVIETHGLTKEFAGRTAVADLDLAVRAGEIYGFLGPNGAGKTTTIRMLTGVLPPSRGQARVAEHDVSTDRNGARASIGLLPESTGYYGWMSPVEYLGFFARLYGARSGNARSRISVLLERVGLADRQHAPIATFSRGMRARLGIARVLVHRPRVLFLDEPTLGLDPLGQRDVLDLIGQINRDEAVTVFLSSHSLDQVGHLCTRVGILNEGRLALQGTPAELRRALGLPSTVHVAVDDASRALGVVWKLEAFTGGEVLDSTHLAATPGTVEPQTDALVRALVGAGIAVHEVTFRMPSLEDVFFALVERQRSKA